MATQLNMEKMREMYPWLTDKQISDMQVREDILFRRYLNGEMNQEEYVKRAKALANEYAKPAPPTLPTSTPTPPTAANWLPTTRPVPTPAGAQGGMPPSPELQDKTRKPGFAPYEGYEWQWNDTVNQWQQVKTRTPGVRSRAVLAGETFEVWARRIGAQDTPYWRSWYLQDKQSRGLMTPEEQTNYLKEQGWSNSIGAYGEHLKTRTPAHWLPTTPGQVVPSQLNQALSQLPALLKDWLSNYPRLPQSTIPTPTVEYPAPGRPPGPSKPGYTNPFAWRRKNNGWW